MNLALGIDIGGTKVAIGIVDEAGKIIAKNSLPTDLCIPPAQMIQRIADATLGLISKEKLLTSQIKGIGIGAPGPLDPRKGRLLCPPNLKSWWDFPLVEELQKYFTYPIRMENDATAATLAEKWIGAAQNSNHFAFVTISTGIGAGLYLHGKLLTGSTGNAGDVGHIVIDPAAGVCSCGQAGCWEWVASGTAIAREATKRLGKEISTQEAFHLANQGNIEMQELIEQVYQYIGIGCVTLINIFDLEKIVLGGGVSQVGEPLFTAVRKHVQTYALNPSGRETAIVPAKLNQDAGVIGAAALIHVPY